MVVHCGDNREVLALELDNTFDAVVTDPPYGLGFMGKAWDHEVPGVEFWREFLRVAKPGAHLVAFGGTRLWHRMAVAIEDAGWEIRDSLMWLYGTGFPKSLDIAKAIDKSAGVWRGRAGGLISSNGSMVAGNYERTDKGDPATEEAKRWAGYGTALKPAWEPIVLARKPLVGTVAANVMEYGCGGLNIDGCRIECNDKISAPKSDPSNRTGIVGSAMQASGGKDRNNAAQAASVARTMDLGRFPANLILDPEAGARLDGEAGDRPGQQAGSTGVKASDVVYGTMIGRIEPDPRQDSGGPSRFFYCAKASVADREEGLEHLPKSAPGEMVDREPGSPGAESPRAGAGRQAGRDGVGALRDGGRSSGARANIHPTVKPTELMRYLCRLITPPGGLILDPFCGSGSTGKAAVLEGFRFFGCEMDPKYVEIARARIAWAEANRG